MLQLWPKPKMFAELIPEREREREYEKSCKEKRKVIIMLLLDANYFACKQTDYIKSGSNKKKNSWLLFPQTLEERNYSKS